MFSVLECTIFGSVPVISYLTSTELVSKSYTLIHTRKWKRKERVRERKKLENACCWKMRLPDEERVRMGEWKCAKKEKA